MNKYFIKYLILFCLNSIAQDFTGKINENAFLFTFKENSFLISGDSIYTNQNKKEWKGKKHHLNISDFVFFYDKKNGYLMHNSGGIIYKFDGDNFDRLDDSFEFKTQYQSFPFLYNGEIYNFGGYGLFTYKNIITYFNESKKETELVSFKTPISKTPFGRKRMFAQTDGQNLFIGSGYGFDLDAKFGNKDSKMFVDYWSFNLNTKEWKKLGEGNQLFIKNKYRIIYDYNGGNLVITPDKIFAIDIKKNSIEFFDNANLDILKSIKLDSGNNNITFNKSIDGFYILIEKPNYENKLIFVKRKDFLRAPTSQKPLYTIKTDCILYYIVCLFLLVFAVLIISKKKHTFSKINSKQKEIRLILNEEENKIFILIFQKHPEFITFPELMDVFEPHLSYESRKKKLRSSLYQIEYKVMGVLKSKNKLFVERKNKEDLRIKEIRIQ